MIAFFFFFLFPFFSIDVAHAFFFFFLGPGWRGVVDDM